MYQKVLISGESNKKINWYIMYWSSRIIAPAPFDISLVSYQLFS